jgi:hypothetical protein
MLVELTIRRVPPGRQAGSPIDGIRVLAVLPGQWRKKLQRADTDIVIRVLAAGPTSAEICAEACSAITGSEAGPWELVSCQELDSACAHDGSDPPLFLGPDSGLETGDDSQARH